MELFGIKLVGVNADNGYKLLLTLGLIAALVLLRLLLRAALKGRTNVREDPPRTVFWTRQAAGLLLTAVGFLGVVSIWLDDPKSLTAAGGLATAGIAFALQKVITAVAGYFTILFSKTFTVGDRIEMGGVRGDVIAVGIMQTTIMEMGTPPSVGGGAWVGSRQFTGCVVTVSNGTVFDTPVYNYSRDFSYIWEEIVIPVTYEADRGRVEEILLAAAKAHAFDADAVDQEQLKRMQDFYFVRRPDLDHRVFYRLTDNWLELTLRFVTEEHGVRGVKDAMSRQIIAEMDAAGIGLASATYDIVGLPPIRIEGRGEVAAASSDGH